MHYLTKAIAIVFLASCCLAQGKGKGDTSTNTPPAKILKQKELKVDHLEGKLILKERDKGSKKESDWKTSKEYPLMFKNNKKAKKEK